VWSSVSGAEAEISCQVFNIPDNYIFNIHFPIQQNVFQSTNCNMFFIFLHVLWVFIIPVLKSQNIQYCLCFGKRYSIINTLLPSLKVYSWVPKLVTLSKKRGRIKSNNTLTVTFWTRVFNNETVLAGTLSLLTLLHDCSYYW